MSRHAGLCKETGKRRYLTYAKACVAMSESLVRYRVRGGNGQVYWCKFCSAFHWGHTIHIAEEQERG